MDVEFSLRSETQAVTVAIYGRLRELKNQGMEPVLSWRTPYQTFFERTLAGAGAERTGQAETAF